MQPGTLLYLSSLCGDYLHVTIHINTTHTSKQNHSPKQNITKEIKPTCLIPSGQSWQISHSWHSIDHRKRAHHWTTWSTWGKQGGWTSVKLTFWWHPVFVRAAREAPMMGVQSGHMTCAITTWGWTSTFFLVHTRSIC